MQNGNEQRPDKHISSSVPVIDLDAHNLRQIEQLNQRGGRTLSIVDLIEAGNVMIRQTSR